METPISKLYNFNSLNVQRSKHIAYEQKLPAQPGCMLVQNALVGIEIEVENIKQEVWTDFYWQGKKDGSLRNNGAEFVSIPLRTYQVPFALEYLHTALIKQNEPDFSPRTSVHIHLNVRDMCWDEIRVLTSLYAIFEKHFFQIAGTKRETSIFCVPLYASGQISNLEILSQVGHTPWHKYNAVNLGTILGNDDVPRFGTIEFRHLYGTMDKEIIINWINNILCLRAATRHYTYEQLCGLLMRLNTTSEYLALYESIFGQYANTRVMVKQDFEYCISQLKINLFGKQGLFNYPYSPDSIFADKSKNVNTKIPSKYKLQKTQVIAPLNQNALDNFLTKVTYVG